MRQWHWGIAVLATLALVVCLGVQAWAAAPPPKRVSIYFHGNEVASKLGRNHYAEVAVTYDGKHVMSRAFYSNSGFGGFTITDVAASANINVHVRIYDNSNKLIKEQRWDQAFGDNTTLNFFMEGTPRYWAFYMYMIRKGNDVTVKFG